MTATAPSSRRTVSSSACLSSGVGVVAELEQHERGDDFAAHLVGPSHDAAFGDRWMLQEGALDLDRAETMCGDLDHFVGAPGKPEVSIAIHVRGVARVIDVRDALPVVGGVALRLAPETRRHAGEWAPEHHDALLVGAAGLAVERDDGGIDAGERQGRGARFDWQQLDAVRVAEDRAAGFRLPHVVDDWHAAAERGVLQPVPRVRVQHFARADDALEPW